MDDNRLAIIQEARSWLDVPFRHQGRTRQGIDCIGLIYRVAKALELGDVSTFDEDNKYKGYDTWPGEGLMQSGCESYLRKIPISKVMPGDIYLMRFIDDPQHLAINAGDTIIHALLKNKKVCEHGMDLRWRKRVAGAYRFPALWN